MNVSKKGKLVFEVAPRAEGEKYTNWSNAINIGLSVEELGELLSNLLQLNDEIKFTHTTMQGETKAMTIVSIDGGYEVRMDADGGEGGHKEVSAAISEGDMEVIKNLINTTLPNFIAWDVMFDQSIQRVVERETNRHSSPSYDNYRNDYDF